jgi:prephenate dehydratase
MKVAIQGERGSFSHAAVDRLLPGAAVVACPQSRDVFDYLKKRKVEAAVIPIENTLAGPVSEHLDLLLEYDCFVQREFRLRIEHNLIAMPGVKLPQVRHVLSHPVALQQCRGFFRKHRRIGAEPFYDTAGSVKHIIANKLGDTAAIASRRAAVEYSGKILLSSLEDNRQNFTRFFLLRRQARASPHASKTSIAFSVKNIPGALFKALSVFALREISLSKIESRPVPGKPWEYVFYVDLLVGSEPRATKALDHLSEIADFVKVLGIYEAAK